jgi:hypothetical protein
MKVRLLDAAVLLGAAIKAGNHKDIGHLDADRTLAELRKYLQRVLTFDEDVIESAIYSCRMLEEEGLFSHPDGLSLQAFIKKLTPYNHVYDYDYSMFQEKLGDWHE